MSKYKVTDHLKTTKYVIDTDPLDEKFFEDIKANNPEIDRKLYEAQKEVNYPPFEDLQQDLFSSLYRYKPNLTPEYKVDVDHLLNRHIMENILKSPKYEEIRPITRLDQINSTVGTEVLTESAKELLKELKEQIEQAKKVAQAAADAQAAKDKEEGEGEGEGEDQEESGDQPKADLTPYEEAKRKLEEEKKKLHKSMKKREVQKSIDNMIENTNKELSELSDFLANWGLGDDASFQRLPYQEKMAKLKELRNNPKLKKIAELAGRYKRMALQKQREKVKRGMDEIYNLSIGSDLGKLIPSELMKIRDRRQKLLFYKDLLEGKLLQYELRGKEKKNKGAIVIALDSSGSMTGTPEIYSKAVALGLLEIAKSQKRNFFCIHFSSQYNADALHTNKFLKTQPNNVEELIDLATYFEGSGTNFEPPLTAARNMIELDENFHRANIIFVTDGSAPVTDEFINDFNKWKKDKNVSLTSVVIDEGYSHANGVKPFSDKIVSLSDMKNNQKLDEMASTLFEGI